MQITNGGLTVSAYAGDGAVLLAFSLDTSLLQTNNLAGFAVQYLPPGAQPYFLLNRLNFTQAVTSNTTPQQRQWTSSYEAPFQKFQWVHFPDDILPGNQLRLNSRYKIIARFWKSATLSDGPSCEVSIDTKPGFADKFELGFTRGYLSSQAYAARFQNKDIRQEPKTLDYDTQPFEAQYEWLGYHARQMIFSVLNECLADPSITVDVFAYDLDEPDILSLLERLGSRLRAVVDNAPLHTGTALEVTAHTRLVASAGAGNIVQGHFKRFAHDKIIIVKKNGQPVKVLTGSANFSVRGLYVQANNVIRFDDSGVAQVYAQAFEEAFSNMGGFSHSASAARWIDFAASPSIPRFSVSFAPHVVAAVSLQKIQDALANAQSSVLFAVMELGGGGSILSTLQNLHTSGKLFSYGVTQNDSGFSLYKPGERGILVPFAALDKHVPPPFDKEWRGGMGQVIHHKFIVIDFNGPNPVVFAGSSNLAEGGEEANGDNLLAFYDPAIARAYAIEAFRLVDHFHFRAVMATATDLKPLSLEGPQVDPHWWAKDYDPKDVHFLQRNLFAMGPESGALGPSPV